MADAQKVIELIFNGVDNTSAVINGVIGNTSKLSGSIQQATQPLADFTTGAVKLEAGLLAAGAAMTVFSIKQASDFQSSVLDLQKVMTEADGPIQNFIDLARDLSKEYGVASTEVVQSIANFKQAGFTAEEAATLTKNALDLIIAGDIEAAQASDLLVAAIKGFGAEASDASVIIDLLNGVSNEYSTSLGELLIGFSRVSPVAKAAGLSFEETAGLLTPGIEVFRSGSEVANALRTSLLKLQSDSAPVQEALAAIGVSQEDANGSLRSARDIYFDVAEAFNTLDDEQKTYYAAQLVGLEQSAKFISITEGLDKTLRIAGDGFDYLGSAALEVAIRMQSSEIAAARVKTSFNDLFISIGTPLLDEFTGIADAVAAIFDSLGASVQDGNFGDLVAYIESVMGDIQSAIEAVARNLPAALEQADLSGFSEGIQAVIDGLGNLFGEIDITTVDGLASAITLAGRAFEGLSLYTQGVIESFKPLFDQLVKVADGVEDVDLSFLKSLGSIGGFAEQANILAGGLNSLLPSIEALINLLLVKQGIGLVGALGELSDKAIGVSGALGQAGMLAAIGTLTYELSGRLGLPAQIDNLVNSMTDSEESLGTWIYELVNGADEAERMAELLGPIPVTVRDVADAAQSAAAGTGDMADALDDVNSNAGNAAQGLRLVEQPLSDVADSSESAAGSNYAMAESMLNMVRPASDAASALFEYAGSAQEAEDKAAGLVPIFDETTGAIIRYEQNAVAANDAVAGSFQGIVPILDEATGKVIGYERGWVDTGSALDNFNQRIAGTGSFVEKTARELEKAAEAQQRWNEIVYQGQIDLQIEGIRSQTEIAVAEIEAGAIKIQAAYDSINVSIENTSGLIGDLAGILYGSDLSLRQQFDLERLLKDQNERQGGALKLQKELTQAQINLLNAQAQSLERGDALLSVEAPGLQPHLEAMWYEIMENLQIRLSADGLAMLLPGV